MQKIQNIINLIDESIKEDADLLLTGGNIIKSDYDEKVKKYRYILESSGEWLVEYQQKLIEETGISNLKIKFTNVAGYFIDVPKSNLTKIPDNFILKQTLVNSSRFVTIKLKEFEQKFLEAQNSLSSREYEIFQEIREKILDSFSDIKDISEKTAFLDFEVGLSNVAYKNNYNKPEIHNGYDLKITGARHAVVEQIERDFISNDLELSKKDYIHIITGPNMGGKSTFLRQNALIVLLSHIGSYVPARTAKIPLTDKIFSRVGASDNLFLGQSTFMVEMQEVANILNNSTEKSFIIIDEVGRGTSTYDGMSIAWAILKELHDKIKAKTLFATHYHELIEKSKELKAVNNFSVAVGENSENIIFLRKIIPGGVSKSYGLEVAKLAGLNNSTLTEAKKMLKFLEFEHKKDDFSQLTLTDTIKPKIEIIEKVVFRDSKIEQKLKKMDINNLTPVEALNLLNELKINTN